MCGQNTQQSETQTKRKHNTTQVLKERHKKERAEVREKETERERKEESDAGRQGK